MQTTIISILFPLFNFNVVRNSFNVLKIFFRQRITFRVELLVYKTNNENSNMYVKLNILDLHLI